MNAAVGVPRTSFLTELIRLHRRLRERIDDIEEDEELFATLRKAEGIYNEILGFKVTNVAIGREKAEYLLSLIEEDCPQKDQVRRFLEAMV